MNEVKRELLIDLNFNRICDELFFLTPDVVSFWVNDKDFQNEYRRLISLGEQDGFYTFLIAAENVLHNNEESSSCSDSHTDYDFEFAKQSSKRMRQYYERGFNDRLLNPKLLFLLGRISVPRKAMKYWLLIPEFSNKIESMVSNGIRIDNSTTYDIMKQVFDSKRRLIASGLMDGKQDIFSTQRAKSALRALEKELNIPANQRVRADIPRPMKVSISDEDSDSK